MKKIIGIQFQEKVANLAFFQGKELIGATVPINDDLNSVVPRLLEKVGIKKHKNLRAVVSLPNKFIKTDLVTIPQIHQAKELKNILAIEIERVMGITAHDHIIDYSIDKDTGRDDAWFANVVAVQVKDAMLYGQAVYKYIQPIAIDVEAEGLKRLYSKPKNIVFINYFTDGNEDVVGIYIYKEGFLIGSRYLLSAYYDPYSLKKEVDRMLDRCRNAYREYYPESYIVFCDDENTANLLADVFPLVEGHSLQYSPFAVAGGLSLRGEKE